MTEYGELFSEINCDADNMRSGFVAYFNNPVMTKTKSVNGCSIYMAKNYCLLSRLCRYLVAIIEEDNEKIDTKKSLDSLEWVSFQTRTLSENYSLPSHSYVAKRGGPLDIKITRTDISQRGSTYNCENSFPITITLLHENGKSSNDYQPNGTLISALETFNTIIVINNKML